MVLEQEIPKFAVWIGPALLWYVFASSLVAVFAAAAAWHFRCLPWACVLLHQMSTHGSTIMFC